jgi:tetratricopeptide (TPR) repeat protein
MTMWTSTSRPSPGEQSLSVRRWLALGIAGLLIVLALPSVWDLWQIDRAGVFLNRAIVTGADAAARAKAGAAAGPAALTSAAAAPSSPSTAVPAPFGEAAKSEGEKTVAATRLAIIAGGDYLITPEVEAGLEKALALMETAAARGPHTRAREIPIWRTYGAAARMLPSDHSFELLLRSRNAGRLDWLGELWLGEVAAETDHWKEAGQAYRRVDVSNLLIYRAEAHIESGEKELALRELAMAKSSLDALADREKAQRLLLDRTGNEPSPLQSMMQRPAERATSLSRIGLGLLSLGRPAEAVPVLEQGLAIARISSPGIRVQRNLRLYLATALAETLPEQPPNPAAASPGYSYFPDTGEMNRLAGLTRLKALVSEALELERTAATCSLAGRILVVAGEDAEGLSLLTEAIRLDPLLAEAYLSLGDWYESNGLGFLAQRTYVDASRRLPDEPGIAAALAVSTFEAGSNADALRLLERAVRMGSSDPRLFVSLGDCYWDTGRVADAQAVWEEGLRRSPDSELLAARLAALRAPRASEGAQ